MLESKSFVCNGTVVIDQIPTNDTGKDTANFLVLLTFPDKQIAFNFSANSLIFVPFQKSISHEENYISIRYYSNYGFL